MQEMTVELHSNWRWQPSVISIALCAVYRLFSHRLFPHSTVLNPPASLWVTGQWSSTAPTTASHCLLNPFWILHGPWTLDDEGHMFLLNICCLTSNTMSQPRRPESSPAIPGSTVLLQKPTLKQLVKELSMFNKPEGSVPFQQHPVTGSCPEPDESSQHTHTFSFWDTFWYYTPNFKCDFHFPLLIHFKEIFQIRHSV